MTSINQPNTNNDDNKESIYKLIKLEIEQLIPELNNAIEIMSTPGHDPTTLKNAIDYYNDLTQRIADTFDIVNITSFLPLFTHLSNNIKFLAKQNTPLTEGQSQPFRSWPPLFTSFLNEPDNLSAIKKLALVMADKNWPQTISEKNANQFYKDLQSINGAKDSLQNLNNLLEFPVPDKPAAPSITDRDAIEKKQKTDISAYTALSINRKNAWLNIKLGNTYLLFPQTDIITIETLEGLHINKNAPAYASLSHNNTEIPVYALCGELLMLTQPPKSYRCAIILKSVDGHFGVLSESITTHTTEQEIKIEAIPSAITSKASPIRFTTKCKDRTSYLIRSDDLLVYIKEILNG